MTDKSTPTKQPEEDGPGGPSGVGGNELREQRRVELEQLFDDWAERRADEASVDEFGDEPMASGRRRDPIVWRGTFSALILLMSAGLMYFTHEDFMYWATSPDTATDLGHLGEAFKSGRKELGAESNTWVKMSGMFMTHELQAVKEEEKDVEASDDTSRKYFICPLYDIVVQTTQPLPEKAWRRNVEIDGAFIHLLNTRRAFPQDLTVTLNAEGRIWRLRDAPEWAQKVVDRWFIKQLGVRFDSYNAYIFLDGETPDKYVKYAYFWSFSVIAPIVPLFLLFLALRRRKEEQHEVFSEEAAPPKKEA